MVNVGESTLERKKNRKDILFFFFLSEVNFCPMSINDNQAMAIRGDLCYGVKASFGWFLHIDAGLRSV